MSVVGGLDRMTLADLIPIARKLSPSEKLKLIRILAEDLDTVEDIYPLEPFKTYDLPTLYNSFGSGCNSNASTSTKGFQ